MCLISNTVHVRLLYYYVGMDRAMSFNNLNSTRAESIITAYVSGFIYKMAVCLCILRELSV